MPPAALPSEDRASNRLPPTTAIKALRWFARVAQISSLQAAMHAPLVGSYALPGAARDRREAYPLPMSLVCEWERKVCRPDCPLPLLLWLGAALLCVHASLRWSDAMRVEWSSLSLTSTHLHGTCYKTKTSSHGQPFRARLRLHRPPSQHLLGARLAGRPHKGAPTAPASAA